MAYQNLLIVIVFILVFSIVSKPIEKTIFSGPFLALILGVIVGPFVMGIFNIQLENEDFKIIAELALALVLFGDASKTNLAVLKKSASIPIRLLLIGLPLTIIFGMIGGLLLFNGFSWLELGILATMLAPTDAALGKAVVTNPAVPEKIREALNIESGLNDGISVPVLFIFIALFGAQYGDQLQSHYGIILVVQEIGIGLVVGLSITGVFIWLTNYANKKHGIAESWKQIILIALSFTCFIVAQLLGGSGFIACFVGGFLYGTINTKYKLDSRLIESVEGSGDAMSLITWVIFGSIIYTFTPLFSLEVVIYSILSLTVIRIFPVLISLVNTDLKSKEKLFIGWFGPRGLATIVFAIIVLDVDLPHKDTIILTVACVIMLSVVLHGLTAKPFINKLNS